MGNGARQSACGGAVTPAAAAGEARESAPVRLRPATRADLPAVATIERNSFADPWSASEFGSVLLLGHTIFLVAVSGPDEEIIGYVVAVAVVDEGEIVNIAVAPSHRTQGLGGVLLDAALAEAEERGAVTLFLEVRVSNDAALGLYASRGFVEISRRKRYYRSPVEDALVLRRAGIR